MCEGSIFCHRFRRRINKNRPRELWWLSSWFIVLWIQIIFSHPLTCCFPKFPLLSFVSNSTMKCCAVSLHCASTAHIVSISQRTQKASEACAKHSGVEGGGGERSKPNEYFSRSPNASSPPFRAGVFSPVVQKVDNAIHRVNHYPADSVVWFVDTYPLDSDLSCGWRYLAFEQLGGQYNPAIRSAR